MSWNGFPKYIENKIINNTLLNNDKICSTIPVPTGCVEIWLCTPYCDEKGENLIKSCINKLKCYVKKESNVYFNFMTLKLSYFTINKDKILTLNQSFIVYLYSCPGRGKSYVGKTERTIDERTYEHGWKDKMSAINKYKLLLWIPTSFRPAKFIV